MEELLVAQTCKYCNQNIVPCTDEGLKCSLCQSSVHARCTKRGCVPGGLAGDLFFTYTCQECSDTGSEIFVREKLSWMQAIALSLYHLSSKHSGLSQDGFFHWSHHIVAFIDRHWELLFPYDKQRKKRWSGTVAGRLSCSFVFVSATKTAAKKTACWNLMYPKVTPLVLSSVYNVYLLEKQKAKQKTKKKLPPDAELFHELLTQYLQDSSLTERVVLTDSGNSNLENTPLVDYEPEEVSKELQVNQDIFSNEQSATSAGTANEIPPLEPIEFIQLKERLAKLNEENEKLKNMNEQFKERELQRRKMSKRKNGTSNNMEIPAKLIKDEEKGALLTEAETHNSAANVSGSKGAARLIDPMLHFNTSFSSLGSIKGLSTLQKLTGGVRQEMIRSPYSDLYLKPYIWVDKEAIPTWVKLMTELQLVANMKNPKYNLPPRGCIDYAFVQPEHIPAINSLCNQFFWPGIDVTDSLQYPEYSIVALYKRLVVGFAFLVPDVNYSESYLSFLFVRPGWRNCQIATFMMYHLIMACPNKDITLHVAVDNPAIFLYQKFGFKIEKLVKDFYAKFYRDDVKGTKNAFFCRLLKTDISDM